MGLESLVRDKKRVKIKNQSSFKERLFSGMLIPLAIGILGAGCLYDLDKNTEIKSTPAYSQTIAKKDTPKSVKEIVIEKTQSEQTLEDTQKLQSQGYTITPENLVYLSRLLYREAGNESDKGIAAVMHTIHNRWEFDNQKYAHLIQGKLVENKINKPRFGNGNLISIVTENTKEFNAIGHFKDDFKNKTFTDKTGALQLSYGRLKANPLITKKLKDCYDIVVGVLTGEIEDPTEGALFYKNERTATSDTPGEGKRFMSTLPIKSKINSRIEESLSYTYRMTESGKIGNHTFYQPLQEEHKTEFTWQVINAKGDTENSIAYYLNGDLQNRSVRIVKNNKKWK